MKADVCKAEDCTKLIDQTVEELGGIDIFINNAGKSAASGLEALSDEAWQEDLDLKLMGGIRMCRGAVPHMKKMGGGSIVNATTGAGKAQGSLALPTSVSRAVGNNLTKFLAKELAKDKIRVNAVCIGLIKSAQRERRSEKGCLEELYTDSETKSQWDESVRLKRTRTWSHSFFPPEGRISPARPSTLTPDSAR